MHIFNIHLIVLVLLACHAATSVAAGNAPATGDEKALEFIVIGDWGRQGSDDQSLVARQMDRLAASSDIDFIATTGDNFYPRGVQSATDRQWSRSFEDVYSLPSLVNIPWFVSLGNHDYLGDINAQLQYAKTHRNWNLPRTYYSRKFKINGRSSVRILFIDTNPLLELYRDRPEIYKHIEKQNARAQLNWMYRTLRKRDVDWRIVIGHHPVYSAGYHGDSTELERSLAGLFEQQKVQAYFAGHDHHLEHYQLAGKTQYFISGGGSRVRDISERENSQFLASSLGFAHVKLNSNCMWVTFINENGEQLYQSVQSRQGGDDCE